MKNYLVALLLLISAAPSTRAVYSSMYIFTDSLSATTNNVNGGTNYFGQRWCNGPIWVEYLAQVEGIPFKNASDTAGFGFYTTYLTNFVGTFPAPTDASNSLFVVWSGTSDLFWGWLYNNTNNPAWVAAIDLDMTNTAWIAQNLYAKGSRFLILPNAVNIGAAPAFRELPPDSQTYLRQKAIQYNLNLSNLVGQLRSTFPALTIYSPDLFTQFENLLANPSAYGLATTNIDALDDIAITDKSTNGPGANHIFWDQLHPTTRVQNLIAQQVFLLMAPWIGHFQHSGITNRLDLVNLPVGSVFALETSTNLVNWSTNQMLTVSNASQTLNLQTNVGRLFFRLKF